MTINNITGTNSLRANCQPDSSKAILRNIRDFMQNCKTDSKICTSDDVNNNDVQEIIISNEVEEQTEEQVALHDMVNYIDEIIVFDPESDEESRLTKGQTFINVNEMIVFDPESDEESNSIKSEAFIDAEDIIVFDPEFEKNELNFNESEALSHASNLILQKLMKFTSCEECKNRLQLLEENATETLFIQNCKKILCGLNEVIPHICAEKSLKKKLIEHIQSIKIDIIGCLEHNDEIERKMKELCSLNAINAFCYDINNLLSGKTDTLPITYNPMQKLAYDMKQKKKNIGKYTDIFNQN